MSSPETPPKEHLLAATLEEAWTAFPNLVARLSLKERLELKGEFAYRLGKIAYFLPWQELFKRSVPAKIKAAKEGFPKYDINETQARISLLTDNWRLYKILKSLGEITEEVDNFGRTQWVLGKASAFVTVMEAFRATLPWTATVGFSLKGIRPKIAQEALDYIGKLNGKGRP